MRSKFASTSWRYRKKTRARSTGGVSRQAGNAAAADSTASSTISAPPIGASALVSPRDGLKTGDMATPERFRHSPLMKIGQGIMGKQRMEKQRMGKHQAPNTKLQRSSKNQTSNE